MLLLRNFNCLCNQQETAATVCHALKKKLGNCVHRKNLTQICDQHSEQADIKVRFCITNYLYKRYLFIVKFFHAFSYSACATVWRDRERTEAPQKSGFSFSFSSCFMSVPLWPHGGGEERREKNYSWITLEWDSFLLVFFHVLLQWNLSQVGGFQRSRYYGKSRFFTKLKTILG